MLRTLFKHEMRATAKTFMWFYIAFAAIAGVNALLTPLAANMSSNAPMMMDGISDFVPNVLAGIFMVLYVIGIVVIAVLTFVIIILRFYRNLLGNEGYLMMTLPVTREKHILSKLFAAVIWSVCTTVLIVLSFLLLFGRTGLLGEMIKGIQDLIAEGVPVDRWIAQFVIILLVSCVAGVLMLYAAMGIGPNLLKNRLGGSILAYIIIYIATQIITSVVIFGSVSAAGIDTNAGAKAPALLYGFAATDGFIQTIDMLVAGVLIANIVVGVVCWFLARYMLKRKLNLA